MSELLRLSSLTVGFAGCPSLVKAKLEIRPRYFTLTVAGVSGGDLDWLQLGNLRVTMTDRVGALVSAAAQVVGGKGGGRPDMAQAGGPMADRVPEVIRQVPALGKNLL